jgi:methionine-rich copper-binding protein CopC
VRRMLLAVAVLLLAVLLPGTPAWAHTALVSADPAADATLSKAPTAVTLVFSQTLNPDFTTIVLSDAAARRIPSSAPTVGDATGSVTVGQPLGNGVYTVAYRVVSRDGHTVQGSYPFTVADPALPAATTTAGPPAGAAVTPAAGSGGLSAPVLIGLIATGVLLVALAAYFARPGRRRVTRGSAEAG